MLTLTFVHLGVTFLALWCVYFHKCTCVFLTIHEHKNEWFGSSTVEALYLGCQKKDQCNNGLCIHPDWICDGVDDCGDMTDEKNCPKNSSKTGCKYSPMSQEKKNRVLRDLYLNQCIKNAWARQSQNWVDEEIKVMSLWLANCPQASNCWTLLDFFHWSLKCHAQESNSGV